MSRFGKMQQKTVLPTWIISKPKCQKLKLKMPKSDKKVGNTDTKFLNNLWWILLLVTTFCVKNSYLPESRLCCVILECWGRSFGWCCWSCCCCCCSADLLLLVETDKQQKINKKLRSARKVCVPFRAFKQKW